MGRHLTYLFLVACMVSPAVRAVLLHFATFNAKVAPYCFNGSAAASSPPRTLDAFLSLVRQIEAAHPVMDAADTAAMLLARFSIDFVDHQRLLSGGERFLVDSAREMKASILEAMLRGAQPAQHFDEARLSEASKCALFSMLSHAFNSKQPPVSGTAGSSLLKNVQEQGVVGEAHNATLSICLGHVLKGLVASKYAQRDTAENMLHTLKSFGDMDHGHAVIDHVYGPTLAVHLGTLSSWSNSKVSAIGGNGFWTTPMCPREFRVAGGAGRLTDAELLGALDGFILAMTMKKMNKDRPRRLSQILGSYYSLRGIRELLPEFPEGLSFCTRKQSVTRLLSAPRLEEQVLLVARLYARLVNDADMKRASIKHSLLPALKSFHAKLDRLLRPPKRCTENTDSNFVTCDTQTDVLIILDPIPGNSIYDNYQKKIASQMAERLLRTGGGHTAVSISAAALSEDASELELLYNSRQDDHGSPSCAIENMARKGCTQCTEVDIWRAVDKTWNILRPRDQPAYPVSPGKVIVYFKFSSFRATTEDVHAVVRHVQKNHEGLKVFSVGPRTDILRAFQHGPRDAVVVIPNSMDDTLLRQIALELTEEVCRAPMSIVCHECQRTAVEHASESLEDFQTPLTVRHWALLPASFADIPRMINVTFESQHLPIKVCLDRLNSNGTKVAAYSNLCQETGSKAKAIRYSVKKICASEKSWSCHSLHFSVTVQPRKAGDLFSECTESGCLLPDQTKIVLTYNNNAYPTLEERGSIPLPTVLQSPQSILKGMSVSCHKYVEAGHGQRLALSMDYFVDLLEKIEAAYQEQNLFDVAAMLLNWFTVNEFDMTDGRTVGRDLREQMTLESWLNPWPRGLDYHQLPALNRSLLDEREMCALFFMLHHSFQESTDNGSMHTIERGVAQVSWEAPRIAVAVAKVLQGIVVGMIDRTGNVTDIWQADEAARDSLVPPIDPQLSATIGVVLAVSSVESLLHRYGGSIMGHEGSWTGETCPSAYRTRGKRHWCSYSLLRGAIDGLLLGKHARRVASRGVSLSQLLRFFYGVSGVPRSVPGAPGLSVCGRRELLYPYLRDGLLEGNVSHMARAYLLHRYGQDSHRLSLFVAAATDEFLQRLRRDLLRNPEFCDRYPPTSEQAECQTPGDIFIVMDADAYANDDWMKQQRRTVELLAQRLNIGKDSRRYLHVYVNKRDMDGALQVQLANETSPSTASCYALTANFTEIATDNEAGVFESLRSLVAKNHYGSMDQLAPSKTIVMFKFGHLRSAPQRLRALLPRVVGSKEESSSIIAIGNNFTSLRKMVRSEGRSGASVYDKVFLLPDDEDAVKEVATKIAEEACTAPAVLRCLECTEREIKKSFSFEGTVNENGVVYIVLSPEDYGGFENLRVKVQSIRGALKVCHQRSRFRHLKPQDCDTVSKNELMFRPTCKDNPCQPLYVAVIGTSEDCYSERQRIEGALE